MHKELQSYYNHKIDLIARSHPAIANMLAVKLRKDIREDKEVNYNERAILQDRISIAIRLSVDAQNVLVDKYQRKAKSKWQLWLQAVSGAGQRFAVRARQRFGR